MKPFKLFDILFEVGGDYGSESNEDIIANVVLGNAVSTDPEEIEANKPISSEFLKGSGNPLPEPDIEEIPFFGMPEPVTNEESNELNEARLTPEERARIAKEKARKAEEKAALKASREAERARKAEEKAALKASREAEKTAKEEEIRNKQEFFNDILAGSTIYQEMTDKNEESFFRICPTQEFKDKLTKKEITKQDFTDQLKNEKDRLFAVYSPKEIKPKAKGSGSGTFYTYELTRTINDKTTTISIVIAAGGNRGNDFEKEAFNEIFNKNGPVWDALMCFLVANGEIQNMSDLGPISNPGGGNLKRPFTDTMNDVGAIISDVTIQRQNGRKPIYVSLKDEQGKTFANPGYGHVFKINKNVETGLYEVTVSKGVKTNSNIDKFLEIIGADKQQMAKGFAAYANGFAYQAALEAGRVLSKPKPLALAQKRVPLSESAGAEALKYLSYQLGYGYIYFRRLSGGGYRIINLDTPEKTTEIFGDFISGEIRYPYFLDFNKQKSSRQFTVSILSTTAKYYVEIRNTTELTRPEGVVASLQCNAKVEKSYTKPYDCQIDWKEELKLADYFQRKEVFHTMDENFKLSKFLLGK